jgi:hypothetical protein
MLLLGEIETAKADVWCFADFADRVGEIRGRDGVVVEEEEDVPGGCRGSPVELQPSPSWCENRKDLRSNLLRLRMALLVVYSFCLHNDYFVIGPDLFLKAFQRGRKLVD